MKLLIPRAASGGILDSYTPYIPQGDQRDESLDSSSKTHGLEVEYACVPQPSRTFSGVHRVNLPQQHSIMKSRQILDGLQLLKCFSCRLFGDNDKSAVSTNI